MEYLSESLLTPPMPWASEPEPLISEEIGKSEFPLDALPKLIRSAVIETLHYTRVPKALGASTALVLHHQFNI